MVAMTKFTIRDLNSCVPICRNELFEDVMGRGQGEAVCQAISCVWICPGHIFVSLEDGCKLLTFDCKPASYQNSLGSTTLDFPVLKPAVLDVFISPLTPNVAYIIQTNGHVHCWKFSSSFQWSSSYELDLCESCDSIVTSVCLHPRDNRFYWCEQSPGSAAYHIKSREDNGNKAGKKTRSSVILQSCPACQVFPMEGGLFIVPTCREGQTRVCLFWKPSVLDLVSISTAVGSSVRNHHDMRSPLTFADVLLNCLPDLCQAPESVADYGAKRDISTGKVVRLYSDGAVHTFHVSGSGTEEGLTVNCTEIAMPDRLLPSCSTEEAWNVHKNVIAITTGVNTIRLFNLAEGCLIHELELEKNVRVLSLARSCSPSFLVAAITSSGVTVVQGGKFSPKTPEQDLPSDKYYQTDALQVALLNQQREANPGLDVSNQLQSLLDRWKDLEARQPRSLLSDTIDGYLGEFWRLEEQAKELSKTQRIPAGDAYNVQEMVRQAVLQSRSLSPDAALSELLWLSQKYPTDLLHILTGGLDVQKEELTVEEQDSWQRMLGLESGDSQHVQYSAMAFELICRLLFRLTPHALVSFVRNAQAVSEQAVGVSAFVRKKHTSQYYVRAMECLPDPGNSLDPRKAASAKAQIILLGSGEQGPEVAVRFLLGEGLWAEAIQLLRQLGPDSPHHTSLFSLLMQHLIQGQALSEYASEVFSLLPSWKSFLPALKVMGDSCSSPSGAATPSGLFYQGAPDIPLSALQPRLMALLSKAKK